MSPFLSENDRLRLVIETQRQINAATLDCEAVMRLVTHRAQLITGAGGGSVEIADGEDMVYRTVSGAAAGPVGTRVARGSLSGLCVEQGIPLICHDSETDPRVDREACRRLGVRSLIIVPLTHGDTAVGVLKVMSGDVARFNKGDIDVLEQMAGFIADSLMNAANHGDIGFQAMHDTVTGLPNRALLLDRLGRALASARRDGTTIALFCLGLDGFKHINDSIGQEKGDEVLRAVSAGLSATLRAGETIAHLGGDKFLVLCESTESETERSVRERIGAAVATVGADFADPGLAASLGVVWDRGGARSASELLDAANAAISAAKRGPMGGHAAARR